MKNLRILVITLFVLSLTAPIQAFGFGGSVNQGSSSGRGIRKLDKKQTRLLLKLGHARLVKQIKKAKRGRTIRALMAKAKKIIANHNKQSAAERKAAIAKIKAAKDAARAKKRKAAAQRKAKAAAKRKAALAKRRAKLKLALQKRLKALKKALPNIKRRKSRGRVIRAIRSIEARLKRLN